jgi:hypothetical protein
MAGGQLLHQRLPGTEEQQPGGQAARLLPAVWDLPGCSRMVSP